MRARPGPEGQSAEGGPILVSTTGPEFVDIATLYSHTGWCLAVSEIRITQEEINARRCGDKAEARAAPPAKPPDLANSCAGVSGFGFASLRSPDARSTISLASWFTSRGRLGCLATIRGASPAVAAALDREAPPSLEGAGVPTKPLLRWDRFPQADARLPLPWPQLYMRRCAA
jgi:hypothetical protein